MACLQEGLQTKPIGRGQLISQERRYGFVPWLNSWLVLSDTESELETLNHCLQLLAVVVQLLAEVLIKFELRGLFCFCLFVLHDCLPALSLH